MSLLASTTTMTATITTTESAVNEPASAASPPESLAPATAMETLTPFSPISLRFHEARAESDAKKWSFPEGDIGIEKFNAAITGFLTIFDALGSPIITEIVRKDFRWKTNGLKNSARRLRADSLRDLVRKELKSPPRFWAPSGIESLLWSHRILQFVDRLVDHMATDADMELNDACTRAYRTTLAVRHPHMTRMIFEKALALVPTRETFVANLVKHDNVESLSEADRELCMVGMSDFLRATRPHIEALRTLFDIEEIEDPHQ